MTVTSDRRLRGIAGLLVVAAVLFVVGVASEPSKDTHGNEASTEVAAHPEAGEGGESAEVRASEGAGGAEGTEAGESGEGRVLGLDLESPVPLAVAVVLSAALAALVLWRPDRRVLVVIAVVTAAFAVLDIAEVDHQLNDDRTGLAVLAATIAAMHAATSALAVWHITAEAAPRAADP